MCSPAHHAPYTGIPAKHGLNHPLSRQRPQPRQTLDLPFPVWWQLRARHTGNAAGLGLPRKGIGMQRRGPTQPREDRMQASACAAHPHSLPVSAGSLV